MQKSDVVYIKAMLWGIIGVCGVGQGFELSDPIFWIVMIYIFLYGIEFIFYRYKEIDK